MNKAINTIIVFMSGMITGSVIGMLYAPDKGSSTRDKMTFLLDKYKIKLQELVDALIDGRDIYSNEAKSEGQRVVSDAKVKAEKLLQDVDDLIGQIKGKQ